MENLKLKLKIVNLGKTKIVTYWQLFLKHNKCVSSLQKFEKRILTDESAQGSRKKTSLEGS